MSIGRFWSKRTLRRVRFEGNTDRQPTCSHFSLRFARCRGLNCRDIGPLLSLCHWSWSTAHHRSRHAVDRAGMSSSFCPFPSSTVPSAYFSRENFWHRIIVELSRTFKLLLFSLTNEPPIYFWEPRHPSPNCQSAVAHLPSLPSLESFRGRAYSWILGRQQFWFCCCGRVTSWKTHHYLIPSPPPLPWWSPCSTLLTSELWLECRSFVLNFLLR